MKLFTIKDGILTVSEEAWGLAVFKKILDRDKTKEKELALAELLYVWFFCDIKSDYLSMNERDRKLELSKDISGLPDGWEPDEVVEEAIRFYSKFETVIQKLYKDSLISCQDIGDYIRNTKVLLNERDNNGKPVYDITKLVNANEKIPKLMANLKAAFQEVIKEFNDLENKQKGQQHFNMFENGLDFDGQ